MKLEGVTRTMPMHERTRAGQGARMTRRIAAKTAIYAVLLFWAFVCLFPIYWTFTTSFKSAVNVTQGHLIPWLDFVPNWKGWRSLGLSPDTIFEISTARAEFMKRFVNSAVCSISASSLALILGSMAAYGLSRFNYRFGFMRNPDISFFFLSQLILPPVVLALPILVLYKELILLDTRMGIIFLYTLMVLPIVIWIMRDQFNSVPIELEEAALVDGLSIWGIVLPDRSPDRGAGPCRVVHTIVDLVLERIFLRRAPDEHPCQHAAGDGCVPDRFPRHQLVDDGRAVRGVDPAFAVRRDFPRALHRERHGGGSREVVNPH